MIPGEASATSDRSPAVLVGRRTYSESSSPELVGSDDIGSWLLGGGLISLSKFNLGDECKRSLRSSGDELMGASSINSSALGNSSSTFLIA